VRVFVLGGTGVIGSAVVLQMIAAELGEWARGYALDQRSGGAKPNSAGGQGIWIPKPKSLRPEMAAENKSPLTRRTFIKLPFG
jgi:nucleoside-diphosphate-sugar epimerase